MPCSPSHTQINTREKNVSIIINLFSSYLNKATRYHWLTDSHSHKFKNLHRYKFKGKLRQRCGLKLYRNNVGCVLLTQTIFSLFPFNCDGGGIIFKTQIINVCQGTFVKWKPLNATFKSNFKIYDSPTLFLLTPFVNFPPWKRVFFGSVSIDEIYLLCYFSLALSDHQMVGIQ